MSKQLTVDQVDAACRDAGWCRTGEWVSRATPFTARHSCGIESSITYSAILRAARTGKGTCASCRSLVQKRSDALQIMKGAGLEPLEPYVNANTPWRCRCQRQECGREVTPTLANVLKGFSGCIWCGALARAHKNTNSEEVVSALLSDADLHLVETYRGMSTPVGAICLACWNPVIVRLNTVQQKSWRCPHCSRVSREERVTKHLASYGWTVHSVASRTALATHDCGLVHRVSITTGRYGDGCPRCASSGFSAAEPGYFYALHIPEYEAIKVGVTNKLDQRLEQHRRNFDYEVLRVWGPMDGRVAHVYEQSILLDWRSSGIEQVSSMGDIPGSTETASINDVSIDDIERRLEEITAPRHFDPSALSVCLADPSDARRLFSTWHYTRTDVASTIVVGLFDNTSSLVGAASFAPPSYPGTASSIYAENPASVIELRRFLVLDHLGMNAESWFLSRALKLLPDAIDVVLAFSDPAAGHIGTIYQATNFLYLGQTSPSYHYLDQAGVYVHKRRPWAEGKRVQSTEREVAAVRGLTRIDDPPKHRYAYPRSRRARKILSAKAVPYCKPDPTGP